MNLPPTDVSPIEMGGRAGQGADPWTAATLDLERRDAWLLSYIDILMLLLALLAMLLALTPDQRASATEPAVAVNRSAQSPRVEAVDKLMDSLAARGLADRLKARKVARSLHLQLHNRILFAPGSAELKSDGKALLDGLAGVFGAYDCSVAVEGHTDNRPIANTRYPSNWELSTGRAATVARYLIGRGYDPARLQARGYADTRPLAANHTPAGRARNRRVSLIVEFPEDVDPTGRVETR